MLGPAELIPLHESHTRFRSDIHVSISESDNGSANSSFVELALDEMRYWRVEDCSFVMLG